MKRFTITMKFKKSPQLTYTVDANSRTEALAKAHREAGYGGFEGIPKVSVKEHTT